MDWTPRPARQPPQTGDTEGNAAMKERDPQEWLAAAAVATVPASVSANAGDGSTTKATAVEASEADPPPSFHVLAATSVDETADAASLLSSHSRQPLISHDHDAGTPRRPSALRALSSSLSSLPTLRRPSLPHSVSKNTFTTSVTARTESVPAYRLFARDADPLVLPDLDRMLEELGGQAEFSPMPGLQGTGAPRAGKVKGGGDEELELNKVETGHSSDDFCGSEEERSGWEDWLRGPPPSLLARLKYLVLRRPFPPPDPTRQLIFPPFHLLPPYLTVTDLKHNRRRPPSLFSFQGVLAAVGNGILGAAGSTTGIGLTTVEGLRDLMQYAPGSRLMPHLPTSPDITTRRMITLLVTAGSPTLASLTASSSTTDASQKTLIRTLFVTVPSALSLDFVSAFGQALLFLLLLTLVTLLALYEFFRFTGGWAGPAARRAARDVGEGYDREGAGTSAGSRRWLRWRDSYGWRVFVTFWCTSLYLPLSKLAIGALVYTDDYWPVTNPYTLYDSDAPSPPPLGAASTFYDPMDFCYRTTMKRRQGVENLNFAYVLLPIAAVVILVLSLWLPWRLWKVVEQEKPTVDGWTELGEKRRDENAEYERLLEVDPSPFSFLYCGARPSPAAHDAGLL